MIYLLFLMKLSGTLSDNTNTNDNIYDLINFLQKDRLGEKSFIYLHLQIAFGKYACLKHKR